MKTLDEYDKWNNKKKEIQINMKNKYYHPREIWWCCLGINIGHEQDGEGKTYERPILIIKALSRDTCIVVPLTTSNRGNDYCIYIADICGKISYALIDQIRVIDTKRLINKIHYLEMNIFRLVVKSIKNMF